MKILLKLYYKYLYSKIKKIRFYLKWKLISLLRFYLENKIKIILALITTIGATIIAVGVFLLIAFVGEPIILILACIIIFIALRFLD